MNTEIEIVNRPEIPSSILLTENVKELIKDLIIEDNEQFERKKYYFESLLRIWLGDNWIGNNLSGNLNELLGPSNTFTKCQKYIKNLFLKILLVEKLKFTMHITQFWTKDNVKLGMEKRS